MNVPSGVLQKNKQEQVGMSHSRMFFPRLLIQSASLHSSAGAKFAVSPTVHAYGEGQCFLSRHRRACLQRASHRTGQTDEPKQKPWRLITQKI